MVMQGITVQIKQRLFNGLNNTNFRVMRIKMKIIEITENKKQYLDLLLLADEQENMIDR